MRAQDRIRRQDMVKPYLGTARVLGVESAVQRIDDLAGVGLLVPEGDEPQGKPVLIVVGMRRPAGPGGTDLPGDAERRPIARVIKLDSTAQLRSGALDRQK